LFKIIFGILLTIAVFISITVLCQSAVRYEINRYVPADLIEHSKEIMLGEVGKIETGHNRGIADKYNKALGLPLGSPYCQSGQYWCYWVACQKLHYTYRLIPMPRSGMANATYDFIKKNGTKTRYIPRVHDFIVWKSPRNYTGHIERIIVVGRAGWVKTVGFNTSSGRKGSQRDGGGVWIRNRNIYNPLGSRRIRGLAGVKYRRFAVKDCVKHTRLYKLAE
jgi:hypothetical protein